VVVAVIPCVDPPMRGFIPFHRFPQQRFRVLLKLNHAVLTVRPARRERTGGTFDQAESPPTLERKDLL